MSMMVHAYHPTVWETEAGGLGGSRPTWATWSDLVSVREKRERDELQWSQAAPATLLSLLPQSWAYKDMLQHLTFYVNAGDQTQVLMLAQ